jgi:hypothetical protein
MRSYPRLSWLLCSVVALPAACRSETTPITPEPVVLEPVGLSITRELDVLFVVDDSASMMQEQTALASGFGRFTEALKDQDGQLPGLHLGVVSSNVGTGPAGGGGDACAGQGDDGALLVPETCAALTDGSRFIRDLPAAGGEREVNYTGTLAEQFGCMAQLGVHGCGFEQHFESMRRALGVQGLNAGFLRPDASLAVVIVADEDDCSAYDRTIFDPSQDDRSAPLGELSSFRCFEFGVECAPVNGGERSIGARTDCAPEEDSAYIESVSSYVDFLRGLKADPDKVFVSAITGDSAPVTVEEDSSKTPPELSVAPTCTICPGGATSGCSAFEALVSAAPAIRMQALVDALGAGGHRQDICAYDPETDSLDFGGLLAGIAEQLAPRIATSCLETAPADTDPQTAGSQVTCEVTESAGGADTAIPACDAGAANAPCFRLRDNPDQCPASGVALAIERGAAAAPAGAVLSLRCALP